MQRIKTKKPVPLEDDECKTFVQYLEILQAQGHVVKFTHTANETYTKSWKQKNRNKAMGVRSGIPDYIIVMKVSDSALPGNNRLVTIEMKRQKGGTVSESQKEWHSALSECLGVYSFICKGADEAMKAIDGMIERR